MRIVVDTNVIISGVFFGGTPRRVVEAVIDGEVSAAASPEIVAEYNEIVREMIARRQGRFRSDDFLLLISSLDLLRPGRWGSLHRQRRQGLAGRRVV